jgi:hypothetical protein
MTATKLRLYNDVLRLLGDVRLATLTDDITARYALDDAWDEGVAFVLKQAPWRFALVTTTLPRVLGGMPGYVNASLFPSDCLQPHAIYIAASDGRECPFDLRDQGVGFNYNITVAPTLRYVSSNYADPAYTAHPWPEHFAQTVAAYLAFLVARRVTGGDSATGRMSQLFASLLPEAIERDAMSPDFWLPYQRNGEFLRAARFVISGANFDFSLKTVQYDISQQSGTPDVGWAYHFVAPADYLNTQGLWINFGGLQCPFDIRETGNGWSTNTPAFTLSYVSTDGLDSTIWPEAITKAVAAYLEWEGEGGEEEGSDDKGKPQKEQVEGTEYQLALKTAKDQYDIPDDPFLRFQWSGAYIQAVTKLLEQGRWRFAIKTVVLTDPFRAASVTFLTDDEGNPLTADDGITILTTDDSVPGVDREPNSVSDGSVSPGYSNRVIKPNDWFRTIEIYKSWSDGLLSRWTEIDYRDELDAFHLNYSPVVLRYVSRIGLDATRWPVNFRDAVLAWLQYSEASADPKMAGVAKAKFEAFKAASAEAQITDDERDVPRVLGGRFVSARYGRGNFSRKQGWPPYSGF